MQSYRLLISKSIRLSLLISLLFIFQSFSNGFELNCGTNGWIGTGFKSGTITNTTISPWFAKGFRVNTSSLVSSFTLQAPIGTSNKINDGNAEVGTQRWEFGFSGHNSNSFPGSGGSKSFSLNPQGLAWDDNTTVLTPSKPQWLIKIGSLGTEKSFKDIEFITIDSLAILIQKPWFYDSNIYVPDTLLGDRGGPASGGVINTWYDQEGDSAIWQIQMCETGAFQQNGAWCFFNPFTMGDNTSAGKGPLYAMALAMVTEYFHLDWVLMASSGTNESQAGMEGCGFTGGWGDTSAVTRLGTSLYLNNNNNTDETMGPNHWIETSYKAYAYSSYPKYFPEDANYVPSTKYANTTGTSGTDGNSPNIANAELINSLFYWYGYDFLYNSTAFWADKVFRDAKDREIAAKLFLGWWNGGPNSQNTFLYNLDPSSNMYDSIINADDVTSYLSGDYPSKIYRAVKPIQAGSKDSRVIGGTRNVLDYAIDKDQIETFFFGLTGDGANGTLSSTDGDGGILHHFRLTDEERANIWTKLDSTFNLLINNGNGPFKSQGKISFRYEWLSLMRVVKGDLDKSFPNPTYYEWLTLVEQFSKKNVITDQGGPKIENDYPYLLTTQDAHVEGDSLIVTFKITEETFLHLDSLNTLEWTDDTNWADWKPGQFVSGDSLVANFKVSIFKDDVLDIAGSSKVTAWVRAFDRNYNATIDTFSIFWELSPNPVLDSADLTDLNGDGLGDKVSVFIKKGEAADADELNTVSNVKYSWPDPGNPNGVNNTDIDFTNSNSWDFDVTNLAGAGLGEITFDYPSKSNYNTSILDKVGPAILDNNPTYTMSAPGDTLSLTFTEPIDPISGTEYFLAFKGTDSTLVDIKGVSGNGTKWDFYFDNNALTAFDYVKIKTESSISDTVDNSAAPNNQWVKFKKLGQNDPKWDISFIKDTNGDGDGDLLTIKIIVNDGPNPISMNDLQDVSYTWPNGSTEITNSTFTVLDSTTVTLNVGEISGYGDGTVNLNFGTDSIKLQTINDSIGPVIDTAGYYEKKIGDTSNDTLHITISEALKNALNTNTEYINLKTVSGTVTKTEVISAVNQSGNDWILVLATGAVGDNDSVNFATGTNIEDNYGNDVQSDNQFVVITKQGGKLPDIEKAYIKDTNGDGIGDEIKFSIIQGNAKDAYDLSNLDSLKFKWPDGNPYKNVTSGLSGTEATITSDIDSAGDGSGSLVLFFPDDENISGSIVDSIGPAISTAYYKEVANEPCSLQVVFTEPITDNLQDNTAYLNIKSIGSSTSSVVSSNVIQVGTDGLTWIFVLPANSISNGDSVNLISSSGIIDQAFPNDDNNNKPHPDNMMVEIEFESDLYTLDAKKSSYWDKDADGIMDNVLLTFKGKSISDSIINLMTFLIEWPDKDGNNITLVAEGDDFTISGQTISWDVTGYDLQPDLTIITDSSNYGGVVMIQPVDDSAGSMDTSSEYSGLQDKMAPVLVSADYYINNTGDGVDSLFVTFSEEITQNIANLKPFIFDDNNYEIELINPLGTWVSSKEITFTNIGSTTPKDGDSVNINSFANIKGSVEQNNPLNKKIELNVYLEITIEQVEYFDTDNRPDGRIDLIKVITDTLVSDEILSNLADKITLPSQRNFNPLSASNIVSLTGENGFEIHVSQNLAYNDLGWSLVNTSTTDGDTIAITEKVAHDKFILRPATYTVIDSLAPVITKGILMPAFIDENNYMENVPDTVIVTFSEQINEINNDEPFNFIINDATVTMTLSDSGLTSSNNTYSFIITDNKDEVIMENDSVQISSSSNISDIKGLVQDKNTHPVPFTIGDYKYAYRLMVYPNPLLRSSQKQLKEKKEAFEQLGIPTEYATENTIAVMVRPYGYVLNSDDIETKITIFDMVGNRIVNNKKLEFQQTNSKQIWYYIWDTMNTKKRLVGNGVYLGQITMKDKDGNLQNIPPARIGVGE